MFLFLESRLISLLLAIRLILGGLLVKENIGHIVSKEYLIILALLQDTFRRIRKLFAKNAEKNMGSRSILVR